VGKTGTGKSSLLKTLYGELELKEGEATVAGFNLKGLDWKKVPYLRRTLGWCSRIFSYSPTGM
jgi:cell division transport system ATP-binding protein